MPTPKRLLLVCHAPSANTELLRDAALRGGRHPVLEITEVRWVPPLQATVEDVLNCDAIVLGTTENFGYMSGALKDFFDRIYYPCLELTEAKPFCYYVRAGSDGTGTCRAIDAITQGLSWRQVLPPEVCKGDYDPRFAERVEELSASWAAGVESGLY
jgi:NAD(P)H-dependent FMN reductase